MDKRHPLEGLVERLVSLRTGQLILVRGQIRQVVNDFSGSVADLPRVGGEKLDHSTLVMFDQKGAIYDIQAERITLERLLAQGAMAINSEKLMELAKKTPPETGPIQPTQGAGTVMNLQTFGCYAKEFVAAFDRHIYGSTLEEAHAFCKKAQRDNDVLGAQLREMTWLRDVAAQDVAKLQLKLMAMKRRAERYRSRLRRSRHAS